MRIAIASGKGGTGKTTLATNLAVAMARQKRSVTYMDCDVEAPNGHLFLHPMIDTCEAVGVPIPAIDQARCTLCGQCVELCAYHALAHLPDQIMIFAEICHSCGGCCLVCPEQAITEKERVIGYVEQGMAHELRFACGRLNIGEAMAAPLIRRVLRTAADMTDTMIITDAPPGTSCSMVQAVRGADQVILVTEPTPFGLHDLELAVGVVRELKRPFGVVINRCNSGDRRGLAYCDREQIPVLAEIPDDRRIAEAYARGELLIDALPEYHSLFANLIRQIDEGVEV